MRRILLTHGPVICGMFDSSASKQACVFPICMFLQSHLAVRLSSVPSCSDSAQHSCPTDIGISSPDEPPLLDMDVKNEQGRNKNQEHDKITTIRDLQIIQNPLKYLPH